MNKFLNILVIIIVLLTVNEVFAKSKKKKIVKKVYHITSVEDDTKPLDIKLPMGKLEAIKIPVRMGTGYSWELVKLGDNLKQPYKPRLIQARNKSDEVSIKEFQIFYVRGNEKGKGSVEFEYKQPFDKETTAEKKLIVTIEVE